MPKFEIAAFYQFARLPRFEELRRPLQDFCDTHEVKGIVLVAAEGINGTLAAASGTMDAVMAGIRAITGLDDLPHKTSYADEPPFLRMKVRLKAEIVTIGEQQADPLARVGTYVEPEDWNALISDPEMLVIDARNSFEFAAGTFRGALDPQTKSFGEFPAFVREKLDPARHKKVAMFCTGGIRCEKATSYMLAHGFEEVFHLKGGILTYLEKIAPQESLWDGACFVFDQRVAVGHGLAVAGDHTLCFGCRRALSAEDRLSPDYEEGVSCPHCAGLQTPAQKASSRERQRQVKLAQARGLAHLGPGAGAGMVADAG